MRVFILLIVIAMAVVIYNISRKGHAGKTKGEIYNVANSKKASERLGYSAPIKDISLETQATSAKKVTRDKRASRLAEKKSYGPQLDELIKDGEEAVSSMEALSSKITDSAVQEKISEIIHISDKIMDAAIADPTEVPQIKKFFRYYLPTTTKLLTSYETLSSQGVQGENIEKGLNSINEMLDVSIEAFKKRLDSLFADQALDIETDIDVMNQMLKREGLTTREDFAERPATTAAQAAASAFTLSNTASAAAAQAEQKG